MPGGKRSAWGMSADALHRRVRRGRWQAAYPGVYATFTGRIDRKAALWAALLHCSTHACADGEPDAVFSHETAAELHKFADEVDSTIHITIPHGRRMPAPVAGVRVHISRRLDNARHPALSPPRTRVEDTAIDLTQTAPTLDDAINWLAAACGNRRTTPARLAAAVGERSRLRWRRELLEALTDVAEGDHSLLELRYHRQVERAHGLPRGERQRRRLDGRRVQYDDVVYEAYNIVIHLDGRIHRFRERFRDRTRDNRAVVRGDDPLRYGWFDIDGAPCETALQVVAVLRRNGWAGTPKPCSAGCPIGVLT